MRVAFLTALFPVHSEIPFLNQIVGLIERGHQVDVYADGPQPGGRFHPDIERLGLEARTRYPLRWPAGRLERWRAAAKVVLGHRGAERRTLLRTLDPSLFWHRAWTLDQLRRTARFLPRRSYDICYCAFGMDAPHALRLRRLGVLDGALVVAFRGADTTKYVARRGPRVYARTFRQARLLLPVCEFLGRRLVELGAPAERVVVHRTGIDLRRWPWRERRPAADGRLRVVSVGRLVEKKGIEDALHAVRVLVDRGIEVDYRVLGDGPRRERLAALTSELGLEGRVRLQGRHQQERVRDGLDGADVLVAPSVTAADGDEEGIPNVLKEAMASGMPVVATRHAGIPELVEDDVSGFLVPERDPAALADALQRLAGAPGRWAAMGRAGRAKVEREYDIHSLNDRLAGLLEQLLRPEARLR
ncbi:MAG TPA: glycosyltransferase [Gemmatimonadales bacterium]|nr:glycosyltransferase [Gemmatimonadales bacterium]